MNETNKNPWKKSDQAKINMSIAANKKWASDLGKLLKQKLSRLTAEKVASGMQKKTHRGYFYSDKMKSFVAWYSTYELRALTLLESDKNVFNYKTAFCYHINNNHRVADIIVNEKKMIEVKPQDIINKKYEKVIKQLNDAKEYCALHNMDYEIWTEKELGFLTYHQLRIWADEFRKSLENLDLPAIRKQKGRDRAIKHYYEKISKQTVTNFCNFCKKTHTQLKITFIKNLKKNNGKYICIFENGHIQGSKAKDHLKKVNPYAAQNKQECISCRRVLELSQFSIKNKSTGAFMNVCKSCRAKKALEKYHANKKQHDSQNKN